MRNDDSRGMGTVFGSAALSRGREGGATGGVKRESRAPFAAGRGALARRPRAAAAGRRHVARRDRTLGSTTCLIWAAEHMWRWRHKREGGLQTGEDAEGNPVLPMRANYFLNFHILTPNYF